MSDQLNLLNSATTETMTTTEQNIRTTDSKHGVPGPGQAELDLVCQEIQAAIDGGWEATLKAIIRLEQVKWEGHWTHDEWWSRECNAKVPQTFNSWMAGVRGFTVDGDPVDKDKYQRLLRTAHLHQGLKVVNARRLKEGGIVLPLPRNYSQVEAYFPLFEREHDLPKSYDTWNEEFKLIQGGNLGVKQYEPPFLAPSEQIDVMAAWESSWQQMGTGGYDQRGVPKPPSQAWSKRCLQAGARSNDNFKPVAYKAKDEIVQESPEQYEARIAKERANAEKTKALLRDLVATKKERELRTEVERIKAEQHRKEAAELEDIRQQCREYCEAMSQASRGVHALLIKLRTISKTRGTVYLNELRAFDNGMLSVHDDLHRIKEIGTEFQEILQLADPANASVADGISYVDAPAS